MPDNCPFCDPEPGRILASEPLAIGLRDGFPISTGHALIVPRRHIASLIDLEPDEARALWALLRDIRSLLDGEHRPDGYNVGVNDGVAAGQTVMHLHVHLIPRYKGDRPDPRGGVRWVIPEKADYWSRRG
jgi:diadenosine tetraphosphate (Ap4A) HIT family hydrolase